MGKIFEKKISDYKIKKEYDKEIKEINPFFKSFLFKWYIWIILYLIPIGLDLVFRFVNEDYKNRGVPIYEFILNNIGFIVVMILIILLIHFFFIWFLSIKKKLVDEFVIDPAKKTELLELSKFKIFSVPSNVVVLFLSTAFMGYQVSKNFIWGLPSYIPDNAFGWSIEMYFAILVYLLVIILLYFMGGLIHASILFYKIGNYMKLDETGRKSTLKDPSGGFKEIGVFLRNIGIIISFSVVGWVIGIYFLGVLRNGLVIPFVLSETIALVTLPIFTLILFFVVPQISYRKKLKKYKELKLEKIFEKKHRFLDELLKESNINLIDSNNKIINKNSLQLQYYNRLILEIKMIRNWPFSSKVYGLVITSSILPLVLFAVEQLLIIYVFNLI